MWIASSPRIVAESLAVVGRLPTTRRGKPVPAAPEACRAAVRGARAPMMSARTPPAWLRPAQHVSWSRTVAAIESWGTAVLAEPVGSGKTWIALAVAHALGERPLIVVPAVLQAQWRDTCARSGIAGELHTLERMSRGTAPSGTAGLVIVDEGHRLRDPTTRRGRLFARWALGRQLLFLTGTPIVNRAQDLITLLRYGLPRDALRLDGIADLEALALERRPPPALGRLVIRAAAPTRIPSRRRRLVPGPLEHTRGECVVRRLGEARLSDDTTIRRLLQTVFLDAAASSDAAWRAALCRYRALLAQAEDAGQLDRRLLRRWAGAALDQTVLWSLLPETGPAVDAALIAADTRWVEAALADGTTDVEWLAAVRALCADDRVTICFARHRATARVLRGVLGDAVAWVEGTSAGLGPHRLAREVVLAAFGPERTRWRARRLAPTILVATDVAAEGLDLQAASRIVHLDLPWTPVRRDQRDGRIRRLGQRADHVESWHRTPPPAIEHALALWRIVHRKSATARRWLGMLERVPQPRRHRVVPCCVLAAGADPSREAVVALRLTMGRRVGVVIVARNGGAWQPAIWPTQATPAAIDSIPESLTIRRADALLPEAITAATRLVTAAVPASPHRLARIQRLARLAARQRDRAALGALDAWLRLARSNGAAGMAAWWEEADLASDAVWRRSPAIAPDPEHPLEVEPIAVALFQSPDASLR